MIIRDFEIFINYLSVIVFEENFKIGMVLVIIYNFFCFFEASIVQYSLVDTLRFTSFICSNINFGKQVNEASLLTANQFPHDSIFLFPTITVLFPSQIPFTYRRQGTKNKFSRYGHTG